MLGFFKWFETEHARITFIEASMKIEVHPNVGTLHVLDHSTLENVGEFLQVMLNTSKIILPPLYIQGGVNNFNAFVHAAAADDNQWDINFMTSLKYLVGKYNEFARTEHWAIFQMRHSLLEATSAQDQNIYDTDPIFFITRVVSLFDRLETNFRSPQYSQQIEESVIKPYFHNLQGLSTAYHQYLVILQHAINMFVPPELREEKRYKEDVAIFASYLPPMFPTFSTDINQYIHLLYRRLVAKSAFPWFDHQNENVLAMLRLSYNVVHLQNIDGGQFGKDLQLTATAIYFLYFVIGKLYPHLRMMEADITDIFSEALL